MSKIKSVMLGFSLALLVAAGLGAETGSARAGQGHPGHRGGNEYQAARHNRPGSGPQAQAFRPPGPPPRRIAVTHTRPQAWQLPPSRQQSTGFGPQNRHHRRSHNHGRYYKRPGYVNTYHLEGGVYRQGSNMGLSLNGQFNSFEVRGR